MKEKIIVYSGALLLVAAMVLGTVFYAESAKESKAATRQADLSANEQKRLTQVKICRVFPQPLVDILKLPGTVEAYQEVDVAAQMGGTVETLYREEGDYVEKDALLLELDVAALRAQAEYAKASYELAKLKYDRTDKLLKQQVASQDQYDDAAIALRTTKAALDVANTNLSYGALRSPIAGFIDRRFVDQGEHIDLGKPVMRVVDIDKVKILLNIPEKDALYFKAGQKVTVHSSNGVEHDFEGTIHFMAMTGDKTTRTYPVQIVAENADHLLRPGMIVRAGLVRRSVAEAIAVPYFTIVDREDGKAVFVLKDGKASERKIEYGIFRGGLVEIVKGLEFGDELIIVGQRNLVEGEEVEVAADLTEMAKTFLSEGRDISQMAMELLQ